MKQDETISDLTRELKELQGQFAELEHWAAESGELGSLADWTSNALRNTRLLVDRLCSMAEPVEELPSCPPPPEASVELAARVLGRVQRFSMSIRNLMQRDAGTLEERTRETLNALAGGVVEHLYLRVLKPIWTRWPELEGPKAE